MPLPQPSIMAEPCLKYKLHSRTRTTDRGNRSGNSAPYTGKRDRQSKIAVLSSRLYALVTVRRRTGGQYRKRSVESVTSMWKGRPTQMEVNHSHAPVCLWVNMWVRSIRWLHDFLFLILVRSIDCLHHASIPPNNRKQQLGTMGHTVESIYTGNGEWK